MQHFKAITRKYNIDANLIRTIEQLLAKATNAFQMSKSTGEWFRTTVGIRQGCLLSPTLFNIFLERIMTDALEEPDGKVSIGGKNITNLRLPMTLVRNSRNWKPNLTVSTKPAHVLRWRSVLRRPNDEKKR